VQTACRRFVLLTVCHYLSIFISFHTIIFECHTVRASQTCAKTEGYPRPCVLGSLTSRWRTAYRYIITIASSLKFPKNSYRKRWKLPFSTIPLSRLTPPPQGTSANIRINQIGPLFGISDRKERLRHRTVPCDSMAFLLTHLSNWWYSVLVWNYLLKCHEIAKFKLKFMRSKISEEWPLKSSTDYVTQLTPYTRCKIFLCGSLQTLR